MPYILKKTNGNTLVTVDDASIDSSTSLSFVGKNYSGYGFSVNENFLKLLENFSYTSAPPNPLQGQLWFNNSKDTRRLEVCYDGISFKGIASIQLSNSQPSPSTVTEGDLWWDRSKGILNVFNSSLAAVPIGPLNAGRSNWASTDEPAPGFAIPISVLEANIDGNPIVTVSSQSFSPQNKPHFTTIQQGITLYGCDANGSSADAGYYFWGTASEALTSNTATTVSVISATTGTYSIILAAPQSGNKQLSTADASANPITYNINTGVLNTVASAALYADLAERYKTDASYPVGTVVVIGGEFEITITATRADTSVAGVISTDPAYRMNADAGSDETHPYVALRGRVPCQVVGPIKKGDMLVTSNSPGFATSFQQGDDPNSVFARSLENFDGFLGIIEVLV
jgi:hypothetical protein